MRRSVEIDDKSAELARDTYQQREERKHLGPDGEIRSKKVKNWKVITLCRSVDLDETFSNYQNFTTGTKILPGFGKSHHDEGRIDQE